MHSVKFYIDLFIFHVYNMGVLKTYIMTFENICLNHSCSHQGLRALILTMKYL